VRSPIRSLDLLDDSRPPGLSEALVRASRLVSDRVGLISEVLFMETTPEEPAVYWAQSRPAELGPLAGRTALNNGNATSLDPDRATMKCVGETVERYCSAFYDEQEFVGGTYEDIPGRALRPQNFALFSESQYSQPDFPFTQFTDRVPVRWTLGRSLLDDRTTWAPASFVYIPYDRLPDEPPLDYLISTGLACGTTYASALLKALSEVVERDAYSIVWQNSTPRPHIDLESVDNPFIRQFVKVLQRLAIQPHAVLLTLDIPIPVILLVMTRSDGPPWTIVASGADLSPQHALLLALEEACLALIGIGRSIAGSGAGSRDCQPAADYSDVTTLSRHGLAHALDPRLRASIEFLTRPTETVKLSELRDVATGNPVVDLRTALREIRPLVTDVVAVDVTTSDVDEVGFKVVRVVAPELQRMDINHRYPHLGGRRLYDVPLKLGLVSTRRDESGLNPKPHPFP
jgi:ribosomal protein S12 methylthiotransferase accessory factor